MRKIIVSEYITLDGVIEDPGGAEGFKHGGWSFHFGGQEQQQYKFDELFASDALLLGAGPMKGLQPRGRTWLLKQERMARE